MGIPDGRRERSAGVLDVRFVNACIVATRQAFRTLLNTELVAGKVHIRTDRDARGGVTALVRVEGAATAGLALCFSRDAAERVVSRLAGVSLAPEDEHFGPMLSRLLAQIAAGVAADLNGRLGVKFGDPEVAVGDDYRAAWVGDRPRLAMPFDSSLGRFIVEIVMSVEQENACRPAARMY